MCCCNYGVALNTKVNGFVIINQDNNGYSGINCVCRYSSAMERNRVSLMKQKSKNPQSGIVNDLVEKFEKMQKMADQERSHSLENRGKVRKLVLQYEEKIKGDGQMTKDSKLDCLGIRRNPTREAKEVALARIVRIQEYENSIKEKEIISKIKRQNEKSYEGPVNDMYRKLDKTPSFENKGKVRKLVLEYEEKIKFDVKEERNSKLDCLAIKMNAKREAKQEALATIVGIQKRSPLENDERLKYHVMKYEEMIRNDADHNRNREQKDDLKGKSQDDRKYLRRKAKDVALVRIRQIAEDEISQEKNDIVYAPVQLQEETLEDDKKERKNKVKHEEIEEGIVKRRIQYFENIIRGNIREEGHLLENIIRENKKEKGDLRGQSADLRKNPNRKAKDIAMVRITQIIQEELSEENTENEGHLLRQSPGLRENLKRKSENIEKELHDYQAANSSGTQGDSACNSDDYEEIIKIKVMGRNQTADLRRKAKDRAFLKIRQIAMEEVIPEKRGIVYALVELWEKALKDEKIEKVKKVIHEVKEKGNVKRHIHNFENVIRRNLKEGDLRGQPWDFRNHLRRTTKDKALAHIRKLVQEEMAPEKTGLVHHLTELYENALKEDKMENKNEYHKAIKSQIENLIQYFENMLRAKTENEGHLLGQSPDLRENLKRKSENIEKELQDYPEANSSGTQGDSASNCEDYEEIIKVKAMGRKQTADLRRKANDRAFLKIRRIAMEEVFPENRGLVYALVQIWEKALKDEKIEKIKKVIHEVIEKGNVKRHIQNFENVIRANLKEGHLRGQPRDFRNHLRRTTKDKALAHIRKVLQQEMAPEKTGLVHHHTELYENALKGDKMEKKNEYHKAIKSQILENLIQYFENMLQENTENEGHLLGQSPDLRENLKRKSENIEKELQDYPEANSSGTQGDSTSNCKAYEEIIKVKAMGRKQKAKIRNILQDVIKEENFEE
ncbi:putative autophagy-related protein 11 [Palaemon carinicauda]|uniref:putative autophagy-related protein 11 n=1 Tax=Palaemon carinicauda TaxID=392227 RepID=UPI0035B64FD8